MFTDCLKFRSSVGHAITEQIVAEQHNHVVSVWSVTFDGGKKHKQDLLANQTQKHKQDLLANQMHILLWQSWFHHVQSISFSLDVSDLEGIAGVIACKQILLLNLVFNK